MVHVWSLYKNTDAQTLLPRPVVSRPLGGAWHSDKQVGEATENMVGSGVHEGVTHQGPARCVSIV